MDVLNDISYINDSLSIFASSLPAFFAILTHLVCHSGQFQAGGEWPALDALSGLHDQISQLKDWVGDWDHPDL